MGLELQLRERIRVQGKSKATADTYWYWCRKYILFLKQGETWVHPASVGVPEAERWLTYLANREHVSKNTQNLALQSICYLYRHVLRKPLEGVSAFRAKRPDQVRDVIDTSEVARLFDCLSGVPLLVAQLIYGCGLRIGDVARLRVQDISFERTQLHIHTGKGDKGRYTCFPAVLHDRVRTQIESMRVLHAWDQENNPNGVSLPGAFRRKSPRAGLRFGWYYLFCSGNLSRGEDGVLCRHHRDKSHLGREIRNAADRGGIEKRVTSHILRHSYATHAHEQGVSMRTLQQLLGHSDIRTTEIYVHADQHGVTAAPSPLERLLASPRPRAEPQRPEPVKLRVVRPDARRTG